MVATEKNIGLVGAISVNSYVNKLSKKDYFMKSLRQLRPRPSIERAKKLLDTFNTEEIMFVKEYVEDRLNVDISFTLRPGHPDYVEPEGD